MRTVVAVSFAWKKNLKIKSKCKKVLEKQNYRLRTVKSITIYLFLQIMFAYFDFWTAILCFVFDLKRAWSLFYRNNNHTYHYKLFQLLKRAILFPIFFPSPYRNYSKTLDWITPPGTHFCLAFLCYRVVPILNLSLNADMMTERINIRDLLYNLKFIRQYNKVSLGTADTKIKGMVGEDEKWNFCLFEYSQWTAFYFFRCSLSYNVTFKRGRSLGLLFYRNCLFKE